jgi:cytidylate kinase
VEDLIRGIEVSDNVSIIAQIKEVREKLIALQQEIGKPKNVVMDGRDIGTKVFPDAKLKLFITAHPEIRAKRRFDELVKKGDDVTFNKILNNLNDRDAHDINRKINPLLQAKDAVLIDNSDLSIQDQNVLIKDLINKKK